jgi:hypothetical protein
MKHTHLAAICLLIATLWTYANAAELTAPLIQGWQLNEVAAPDSSRDYNPHSKLILPDGQCFGLVQAQFSIHWSAADNDKEELEHSYADIMLTLPDGTTIAPIASVSTDGRIGTFSSPEREDIEAKENWGAEQLRWGALFILPSSSIEQAEVTFLDTKYPVDLATNEPPHASESLRVEITSINRLKTHTSAPGAERRIPAASLKLTFPGKGLLQLDLSINALKPNIIGGENRMIFRPSDFSLKTAHGSIEPTGILGSRGQIIRSTIYNISRKSLQELPSANQEMSLLFNAPDDFKTGQLEYFGKAIAEVAAPTE